MSSQIIDGWIVPADDIGTEHPITPTPELERNSEIIAIAWIIPGNDQCRDNGWIDCMAWQDGEFSKPLCSFSEAAAAIAKLTAERDLIRSQRNVLQGSIDQYKAKAETAEKRVKEFEAEVKRLSRPQYPRDAIDL